MNNIPEILANAANIASDANKPEVGDYIGDNGLLMCGKCHTPKQCVVNFIGHSAVCPCICKCKEEERDVAEEEWKKIKEMEYIDLLKKNSLMDARFENCTFENTVINDENRKNFGVCKKYAEDFDRLYEKNQGLILCGDVGTGKTHLASCIANYLIGKKTSVFVTSLSKIIQQTSTFDKNAEDDYIRRMNGAKLLILDDLGVERNTDYAMEIVYNVIDSRYRVKKPMIITTNNSLEEMKGTTDMRYTRIYDRIFEVCYPLVFTGESIRKKKAGLKYKKAQDLRGGGELA